MSTRRYGGKITYCTCVRPRVATVEIDIAARVPPHVDTVGKTINYH